MNILAHNVNNDVFLFVFCFFFFLNQVLLPPSDSFAFLVHFQDHDEDLLSVRVMHVYTHSVDAQVGELHLVDWYRLVLGVTRRHRHHARWTRWWSWGWRGGRGNGHFMGLAHCDASVECLCH